MPRPGPRPYECLRRSWHSDRHQSIRGSIIQQIFRVVHENHSTSTKKNREWQEKLPVVVLKSEEIMYSKANSEAEYIDPDTLWDRVNDAINTIIRKDDSIETGEFLPPCVEAALNLGCLPERTSRSQRNSNTRSYLSPRNQDPDVRSPKNIDAANPNCERPNAVNQTHISTSGPSFYPPSMENKASLASASVYPLYYGVNFQPRNPIAGFQTAHEDLNRIIVGKPVFQTVHERLPPHFTNFSGFNKTVREEPPPSPVECDLSLRLGLVSSSGCEKGLTLVDDVDLGQRKEFSFFPLNSEGEHVENLVADVRKRKAAPINNSGGDGGRRWWRLEPDFNQKRRGL